jgi:pimeloyl-ACP methyl ester carboxylesterase
MQPLDTLAEHFTIVAYDRRESGSSGGRIEKLSWALLADQAKALLDHLKISAAYVLGGCMGCSVALAFAARHPTATRGLILHWPVGGFRWKLNGNGRFARHVSFAREHKAEGVIKRAQDSKSFWADPEAGPWASVIVSDPGFAEAFRAQDFDRYLGLVGASGRTLFDRDTAPGAEPEEIMAMKAPAVVIPGDDPSHATSAAHYLRERNSFRSCRPSNRPSACASGYWSFGARWGETVSPVDRYRGLRLCRKGMLTTRGAVDAAITGDFSEYNLSF